MVCVPQHGLYYEYEYDHDHDTYSMASGSTYYSPGYDNAGVSPGSSELDQGGAGVPSRNSEVDSSHTSPGQEGGAKTTERRSTRARSYTFANFLDLYEGLDGVETSSRFVSQELRRPPPDSDPADFDGGHTRKRRRSVLRPWDPAVVVNKPSEAQPTRPRAGSFPLLPAATSRLASAAVYPPEISPLDPSLDSIYRRAEVGLHIDMTPTPIAPSPLGNGNEYSLTPPHSNFTSRPFAPNPNDNTSEACTDSLASIYSRAAGLRIDTSYPDYPPLASISSLTPSPLTPSPNNTTHTSLTSPSPFSSFASPLTPADFHTMIASAGVSPSSGSAAKIVPPPGPSLRERRRVSLSISFPNSAMARFKDTPASASAPPSALPPCTLPPPVPEFASALAPSSLPWYTCKPHAQPPLVVNNEFRSNAEMHGMPGWKDVMVEMARSGMKIDGRMDAWRKEYDEVSSLGPDAALYIDNMTNEGLWYPAADSASRPQSTMPSRGSRGQAPVAPPPDVGLSAPASRPAAAPLHRPTLKPFPMSAVPAPAGPASTSLKFSVGSPAPTRTTRSRTRAQTMSSVPPPTTRSRTAASAKPVNVTSARGTPAGKSSSTRRRAGSVTVLSFRAGGSGAGPAGQNGESGNTLDLHSNIGVPSATQYSPISAQSPHHFDSLPMDVDGDTDKHTSSGSDLHMAGVDPAMDVDGKEADSDDDAMRFFNEYINT